MQKIYCVETGFSLHVNEVPEVPAHKVIDFQYCAGGYMASVVSIFWSENRPFDIFCGKLFHFVGDHDKVRGFKGIVEKISDSIRSGGEFVKRNG